MKRGEIWTVGGGPDYAGKPRPAVIVQDDRFDATDSITLCFLTTDPTEADLLRIPIEPDAGNGLRSLSQVMVDKITTARRSRLGTRVGRLSENDLRRLERAVLVFLGMTRTAHDAALK